MLAEPLRLEVDKLWRFASVYPSQWEGFTPDGERVYVRYHCGRLSVDVNSEQVFETRTGGVGRSYMATPEMLAITGIAVTNQEGDARGEEA